MSIHGIRSTYGVAVRPEATSAQPAQSGTAGTAGTAGAAQRAVVSTPAVKPPARAAALAAPVTAIPVQPPQGTDPALWSVLTQDERSYFAKLGAMGPLTYGRVLSGQMPTSAPMARGGRLDVKA